MLPTGTFVKIMLYSDRSVGWFINVEIYPTIADLSQTSGLCGFLDNNFDNDLQRKDGTRDNIYSFHRYRPPDIFSKSWQ